MPLYVVALMMAGSFAVAFVFDPLFPLDVGLIDLARVVFDLDDVVRELFESGPWWVWCGVPAIVVALTQLLFVMPLARSELRLSTRGRSIVLSLVVGAGVAAMLTVGMTLALLELCDLLGRGLDGGGLAIALTVLVVSWGVWTAVFLLFTRNSREPACLERLVGVLLSGTIIETIAIVPVDVMVRRRTDCYCGTGTFYALLISAWATMWLAGPGALVLYLRRRRRRARTHCVRCGYPKGPSPADRCPECGNSWG